MIIDFNKNNGGGGGDLSNYYTKSETDAAIDAAISGITVDLSDYYTSDEVDEMVETVSRVASAAINELQQEVINVHNDIDNLDIPDVSNFVTSGDVQIQINDTIADNLSAYYTSAQTETAITSKGYITSGQAQTQIDAAIAEIDIPDTTNFVSKDELLEKEEVISTALNELHNEIPDVSTLATAADLATVSGTVSALTAELSEAERVTSVAVNEVKNDITTLSGATANMVTSDYGSGHNVTSIWQGSQDDYNMLTQSGATANPTTFYIITGTTS